jgi:hypothetical protein
MISPKLAAIYLKRNYQHELLVVKPSAIPGTECVGTAWPAGERLADGFTLKEAGTPGQGLSRGITLKEAGTPGQGPSRGITLKEAGTPSQGMHTCSSATVAFPENAIPDGVGLLDPPGKSDKEVLQQGIKDLLA